MFTKALNSIYGRPDRRFFLGQLYNSDAHHIAEFNYGSKIEEIETEEYSEISDDLMSLVETRYGETFYLIKVVKLYEKNKIFLIKPKTLRFWLRSIALRDADEVFSDLIKAGY